jgi:ABC-2 type transport system ATP-binding protein/lipopolysaccharide transport system ATP-binding protein
LASTIVSLDNVSVCYRLASHRVPSLKEYAIHLVTGSLTYRKLWALSGVSFSVAKGENLGIVGRNGAGKSTLLKVISRVLKPTGGKVAVNGRVAPILALGTGFDYELTGRENILLNALLLGHSRVEVKERMDEIVEFSGLGDFVHSPVRNYSSGMVARLGFAVATAWLPDVLLLDEVLSVGDAHFVNRCNERLDQFRTAGTTVVMVSHQIAEVRRNCTRCIWLDDGKVRADGPPAEVIKEYEASAANQEIGHQKT